VCATERPPLCLECGGARFKNLRMGVTRAREELAALLGRPVVEVTADGGDPGDVDVVGTEAVLHRMGARSADSVVILDADQELLAPRYRAAEQALALFARAARVARHRLLLQTRLPDHPAIRAALVGDPRKFTEPEAERRRALRYPPYGGLAVVSGAAAPAWAAAAPDVLGVDLHGPSDDGRWLVRAPDTDALADYLEAVDRPPGRLRVEVDPQRV
jgi:primosomal protein N' (replication factor Y)